MDITNKTVLACIDGSAHSQAVCDYAAWISKRLDYPLQLFHTIARPSTAVGDLSGAIGLGSQEQLMEQLTQVEEERSKLSLQQGKLMLNAAKERVQSKGIAEPILTHRHGSLAESLLDIEANIRVLVLGISGEPTEERHLSAQLESTIRSLHSPILVVNSEFKAPERIMLAYDGSEASGKALDMLAKSPLFKGIPVHLVTVGEDQTNAEKLQADAADKLTQSGHQVVAAILNGKASEALCQYQADNQIDLTLMGAYSHTRLREIVLGSLTAKMLLGANKPLWLLR